jgi:hypothetical protein
MVGKAEIRRLDGLVGAPFSDKETGASAYFSLDVLNM